MCERCSQEATGELLEIERLTSSLERGHGKSTRQGNSLVAYSTVRTVFNGGHEETYGNATRLVPTQLRRARFQPQLTPSVRCLVTCCVTGYTASMITGFKHKGLERFFLPGTKAGIQPRHAARLRLILARLHASIHPQDMHLPGLDLHELTGDRQGTWAVKVSGNWRVTFVFRGEDAESVDYEDYH